MQEVYLSPQEWAVAGVISAAIVARLLFRAIPSDLFFLAGALLTSLFGIVTAKQLWQALINEATVIVVSLYLITHALVATGLMQRICSWLVPKEQSGVLGKLYFFLGSSLLSVFFRARIPLLCLYRPFFRKAKEHHFPVSFFYYLAQFLIIAGACSAAGSLLNILLNGIFAHFNQQIHIPFFGFALIGLPCLIIAFAFRLILAHKSGQDNEQFLQEHFDGVIPMDSAFIGRKVSMLKKHYPQMYVYRGLQPLPDEFVIHKGDLLRQAFPAETGNSSEVAWFFRPSPNPFSKKDRLVLGIVSTMFLLAIYGLPLAFVASGAAALLIALRLFPWRGAFAQFPWHSLILIVSGLIFLTALENSSLALDVAQALSFLKELPLSVIFSSFFLLSCFLAQLFPSILVLCWVFPIGIHFLALTANNTPHGQQLLGMAVAFGATFSFMSPYSQAATSIAAPFYDLRQKSNVQSNLFLTFILFLTVAVLFTFLT